MSGSQDSLSWASEIPIMSNESDRFDKCADKAHWSRGANFSKIARTVDIERAEWVEIAIRGERNTLATSLRRQHSRPVANTLMAMPSSPLA